MRRHLTLACGAIAAALALAPAAPAVGCGPAAPRTYEAPAALSPGPSNDPASGRQWGLAQIGAPAAWARGARGAGATIAILDSGVDLNHPDLAANLLPGRNMVAGDGPAECAEDVLGHGTHVAGIAAAVTGNGIGVAGVAPHAKLLPLRVARSDGSVDFGAIADAIRYAADAGAEVINLSLGGDFLTLTAVGPVEGIDFQAGKAQIDAALEYAWGRGSVIVGAAMNGRQSMSTGLYCGYPAEHPLVVCVGATDKRGLPASYSNLPTKRLQEGLTLMAPGGAGTDQTAETAELLNGCTTQVEEIYSTYLGGVDSFCETGYEAFHGTSMASPHVAGVAALLSGCGLTAPQIVDRLRVTSSNAGRWDPLTGYGIVNANAATQGLTCAAKAATGARSRAFRRTTARRRKAAHRPRT